MLQQHQNMRSLAGAQRYGTYIMLRSIWPTLRQHSTARNGSNGPAAVAAAAQRTAAAPISQSDEQQHTPHVSVLLQEVLHNLNHMPIKVRKAVCLAALLAQHEQLLVRQHLCGCYQQVQLSIQSFQHVQTFL